MKNVYKINNSAGDSYGIGNEEYWNFKGLNEGRGL